MPDFIVILEVVKVIESSRLMLLISVLLIVGCSGDDDGAGQKQAPTKHLLQGQVETIDKAREVEKMLQQSHEAQRQALDEI